MAIIIGVTVSLMIMIVMVIIAVITVRVKSQMGNNHHEMTRSDSDRRLSQNSHGYCTTISSDVAVSKKQIFFLIFMPLQRKSMRVQQRAKT